MSPERTCVGCRQKDEQGNLHRFVRGVSGAWEAATQPRRPGARSLSLLARMRWASNEE